MEHLLITYSHLILFMFSTFLVVKGYFEMRTMAALSKRIRFEIAQIEEERLLKEKIQINQWVKENNKNEDEPERYGILIEVNHD